MFYLDMLQRLGEYSKRVTDLTGKQERRQDVFTVDGAGILTQHFHSRKPVQSIKQTHIKNKNLSIVITYKITLKKTEKINN